MQCSIRCIVSFVLIFAFFFNNLLTANACGPSYLTPVFEYSYAPENPYENFARGKIGILKPTFHRSVLFAAYRYFNGGSFSAEEQKNLVEVWNAEFNKEDYQTDDAGAAVKSWVEKRKDVTGKEEVLPDIYTEREYGGYNFFPNCTKSAFETATQTLSDRIASYGSDNKDVKDWLKAQDAVFANCSSGKQLPEAPNQLMPEWLQKDRAYQAAAAEFYSLNYDEAKRRFAEIAQDSASSWQETADYLVARTLIRQASLAKSDEKADAFYREAEQQLQSLLSKGNKFSDSAEKLSSLIKYRLYPEERTRELAQKLAFQSGNQDFRQDLIDYTWLLDKFEKESLEKEEKRKEAEKPKNADANVSDETLPAENQTGNSDTSNNSETNSDKENLLSINFSNEDYSKNWTIYVKPEATDEEAVAEAEKAAGTLTEKMKEQIRSARRYAYENRFSENRRREYQGGYYGTEEKSLSVLPEFLRQDDLTDWLFTFQIQNTESYLYSLSKFRQSGSDLWLMTAFVKANKNSTELKQIFEAAGKISRTSPVYPTVAFHSARILIEQGKTAEARKMLDEILNSADDLPISSRNQFLKLRTNLAETLDEFLRFSQRKPFAFDMDGKAGTIEDFIKIQKSYYNPEYDKQTREEYENEVEERFKEEKLWENRSMFDLETTEVINQHLPISVLIEAEKSPALPDYLRQRFAFSIWTRSILLEDYAAAEKIAPEVLKFKPEWQDSFDRMANAKTLQAKQNAALFFLLKNPQLTPFVEDGLGRTDNEFNSFDIDDWWCAPYEPENEADAGGDSSYKPPAKPTFLTDSQSQTAKAERKKLINLGDAPTFLGEKVLAWAKRSPIDKRIPESLFIVYQANGWTKYGCGNNEELREKIGNVLKTKYPQNPWTQKLSEDQQ